MRGGIDIKSFLIGGFLVLSLMYSFGAVSGLAPATSGRFAMARTAGHAFILDTATGQVWSLHVTGPSGHGAVLVDVPRINVAPLVSETPAADGVEDRISLRPSDACQSSVGSISCWAWKVSPVR